MTGGGKDVLDLYIDADLGKRPALTLPECVEAHTGVPIDVHARE